MTKVIIPISLRRYTEGQSILEFEQAENIAELLRLMAIKYPQLKANIFSDSCKLHSFVNAFVNGKNIRQLEGSDTKLDSNSEVTLVAAIAGG